jgi:dihydrodipicolinate synthase/N-acetylneuraminate lyase
MSSFQGIWVPLVTPFQNGAIDFVGLRRLVGHLLEKRRRWPRGLRYHGGSGGAEQT